MTEPAPIGEVLKIADAAVADRAALAERAGAQAVATALAQQPAPSYDTQSATLWRQLDEQRQHYSDMAAEYAADIAALNAKRDDALHAMLMIETAMQVSRP